MDVGWKVTNCCCYAGVELGRVRWGLRGEDGEMGAYGCSEGEMAA